MLALIPKLNPASRGCKMNVRSSSSVVLPARTNSTSRHCRPDQNEKQARNSARISTRTSRAALFYLDRRHFHADAGLLQRICTARHLNHSCCSNSRLFMLPELPHLTRAGATTSIVLHLLEVVVSQHGGIRSAMHLVKLVLGCTIASEVISFHMLPAHVPQNPIRANRCLRSSFKHTTVLEGA